MSVKPLYRSPLLQQAVLILLASLPLMRLIYLGIHDDLGANPIEFITRSTGTWALVFLCATLSITPLRQITNQSFLLPWRRTLGLACFSYALLHFLIWFWLDHGWSWSTMVFDVIERPFITMGFLSFVMLLPLAITSNTWAMRSLGRQWKKLHRLIYVIAVTVILHYFWHKAGKQDFFEVSLYALLLGFLLLTRMIRR
jgi:sulfoxide reductase heme-binding subunit YedZ